MATKKKRQTLKNPLESEFRAAVAEVREKIDAGIAALEAADALAREYGITVTQDHVSSGIFGDYKIDERWDDLDKDIIAELTGGYFSDYGGGHWEFSSC